MGVEVIIKIAAIGLLTAIIGQILKQTGREEISTIASLAGLILVIIMVLNLIGELFATFNNLFKF